MSANGTVYELAQEKFNNVKQKVCVFGNGVTLKPGSFGIGLFAEKNFSKGDPITLYGGQLIDMQKLLKRRMLLLLLKKLLKETDRQGCFVMLLQLMLC